MEWRGKWALVRHQRERGERCGGFRGLWRGWNARGGREGRGLVKCGAHRVDLQVRRGEADKHADCAPEPEVCPVARRAGAPEGDAGGPFLDVDCADSGREELRGDDGLRVREPGRGRGRVGKRVERS